MIRMMTGKTRQIRLLETRKILIQTRQTGSDTVTEDKTSGDMASEAADADHENGGAEADNSSHTADSAAGTDNRSDAADGADISDAQTLSKAHIEKHEVPLVGAPSGV